MFNVLKIKTLRFSTWRSWTFGQNILDTLCMNYVVYLIHDILRVPEAIYRTRNKPEACWCGWCKGCCGPVSRLRPAPRCRGCTTRITTVLADFILELWTRAHTEPSYTFHFHGYREYDYNKGCGPGCEWFDRIQFQIRIFLNLVSGFFEVKSDHPNP